MTHVPTKALLVLLDVATDHIGCLANEGRDNEMREVSEVVAEIESALRTKVHAVSATAVMVEAKRHQTAMCGTDLGSYEQAIFNHPIANYMQRGQWATHGVTCAECLARERAS